MKTSRQFDVLILGSGFGGSLLAAILAKAGLEVALVDRQQHPRFAIGESSTPVADLILHDIAVKYSLPELLPLATFGQWQAKYPQVLCGCKRGFSYFWHCAENGFHPTGDHHNELFVTANASREHADTQWYRPDVDRFLFELAQKLAVDCYENTVMVDFEHEQSHCWQVTLKKHQKQFSCKARLLIDATGPAAALMQHLNIPSQTAKLQTDTSAAYGHWRGVASFEDWLSSQGACTQDYPFPCDDSVIHHLFQDGWTWQIRFANGLTSLGTVYARNSVPEIRNTMADSHQKLLFRNQSVMHQLFSSAHLAEFPGRIYHVERLQRLWGAGAGVDWAALPHTIGFIDPLHSTGIAHTLSGVERLSEIILGVDTQQRALALQQYSQAVIEELKLLDLLISGSYLTLSHFELFASWVMIYFAAATTFEKKRQAGKAEDLGFLCSHDAQFVRLVTQLYSQLQELRDSGIPVSKDRINQFRLNMRKSLQPYDHVGLFQPKIHNMYYYTAANKPIE